MSIRIPKNDGSPESITVGEWDEAWKFPNGLMILRYWNKFIATWVEWDKGLCISQVPVSPLAVPSGTFIRNPAYFIGDASYGESDVGHWFESDGRGSLTSSPAYYAVRVNQITGNVSYCIMAVGRWK